MRDHKTLYVSCGYINKTSNGNCYLIIVVGGVSTSINLDTSLWPLLIINQHIVHKLDHNSPVMIIIGFKFLAAVFTKLLMIFLRELCFNFITSQCRTLSEITLNIMVSFIIRHPLALKLNKNFLRMIVRSLMFLVVVFTKILTFNLGILCFNFSTRWCPTFY